MAVEGSETDDKRPDGLSAAKRAASRAERTGANPPGNWPIPIDRDAVHEAIIEINRAGMFVCDRSYRIWEVDGAFLDMEGLDREDVIGRSIEEVLGPRVFALRKPFFDDAFEGRPSRIRVAGIRSHTRNKLLDVYFQPVLTADGEVACVISAARDISHFQAMNERLSLHEEIVAQTTDRISVIGTDFRYLFTNAANGAFHRRPVQDFIGRHVRAIIGEEAFDLRARSKFEACFAGHTIEYEYELLDSEGVTRVMRARMDPYRNSEREVSAAILVLRDITAASMMAKELRRQAREDALTGLANRHALQEDLEALLERVERDGTNSALITVDLDGFKVVNDISGHSGGDALLCQIADMLRTFEQPHKIRCARLGGDEFAVVCEGADEAAALDLANRMVANLVAMRFVWNGDTHVVSASVGIAMIEGEPRSGRPKTAYELLNRADQACLHAKEVGGARAVVYRPDDAEMVARRADIGNLQILQQSLDLGRFQLYTMPIRPVDGTRAPMLEVLLRFLDDEGRVLAPAALIGSAERHGLMPQVDRRVVETALDNIGRVAEGTLLSINLSGRSVGDPQFKDFLLEALDARPGAAQRVCFEITETAAVRSMSTAQALIFALRERGCGIILDDFGSGLSSFAYLRQFRIDSLKIDGAIIGDVVHDELQQTIVAGIVAIARKIGVGVIAEYVEDEEALDVLHGLGVTQVQGYHVGKPAPWVGTGLE
ncbi:putative bifunctional diguanylate cyclase/phosphodiesterase [Stappia sp.]|uniref:putative bifunctional diguanylate cyclase/phosphodiesterase n=1 Tax=Stappia sp. TaxID=1870903 RepID=UPI003A995C4D